MPVVNGEFDAIARLASHLTASASSRPQPGETWIGDDAAVLRWGTSWLLLATDTVVEGVHADLSLTGLDDLGWKVMAANVSDVAAMGGSPGHAVVSVAAPPDTDLDLLYSGIGEAADAFDCPVVGGDLSNAAVVVVTVTVTGAVEGPPVLRSGALPGDDIWITGALGASAAGLRSYRHHLWPADDNEIALRKAYARPVPALAAGIAARIGGARAMIDVSDGLAADLCHVADASRVGVRLDLVPVAAGATETDALGGGEDYALVFCAPDDAAVIAAFNGLDAPLRIGVCTAEPSVATLRGQPLRRTGWQHSWSSERGGAV